jgi:hypothetical protein
LTATAPFVTTGASTNAVNLTSAGSLNITASGAISATGGTSTGISASASTGPVVVTIGVGSTVQGTATGLAVSSGTASTSTVNLNGILQNVSGTGSALTAAGGAITLNIGTAGRINGASTLTGGNDVVNNAGVYNAVGTTNFGTGADVFNNLPAGTVISTAGFASFSNLETFNNAGAISLVDNAVGDRLTMSASAYVGTGGASLGVDVVADAGTGRLLADRLVVASAAGTTAVALNRQPGTIVVDPEGVVIVQTSSLSGTPFTLAGPTRFGLVNFALEAKTVNAVAGVYLVSNPDVAIFDISTFNNLAQDLWFQSADAFAQASAAIRNGLGTERKRRVSLWGLAYGGKDRYGENDRTRIVFGTNLTYSDRLETTRRGAQAGVDFQPRPNVAVGVTGGYEQAEADLASGTEMRAKGYNFGAYVQFIAETGVFGGLLAKRDQYDMKLGNGALISQVRPDGTSTGVEAELGYRTSHFGPTLEIGGAAGYARTSVDDFETGNLAFDNSTLANVRARVGARVMFGGALAPFFGAKLLHEARRDTEVQVRSGAVINSTLAGEGRGTWGRLEAGLAGGTRGGPLLSVWTDVGDVKGFGLAGGFRF